MWRGRQLWLWLAVGALLGYYLVTGENPVNVAAVMLTRGRRLTTLVLDSDGSVLAELDDVCAAAAMVLGESQPVDRSAMVLAIMSGSEDGKGNARAKAAVQRVALNRGGDVVEVITGGAGLGQQGKSGRQFSTARDAYEQDLEIARANLAGQLDDETMGAKFFVHTGGIFSRGSYRETCAAWFKKYGVVPVDIGDVGTLRVFPTLSYARQLGVLDEARKVGLPV